MISKPRKVINLFSLTMINVAAVVSLTNLPIMAEEGLSSVFFYFIAGFCFFIPVSLVSAELATGWPSQGGVYTWVKAAFGRRAGFIALWLQWMENVIWTPTVLSLASVAIAYVVAPQWATNKYYLLISILVIFWGCTVANLLGMRASNLISTVGVILGTLIPGAVIIVMGIAWFFFGKPSQITFTWQGVLPNLTHLNNLVFLTGVLLGMSGMEMSAVHAKDVKDPEHSYPKAIFSATTIILILLIFGSLSIAILVPKAKLDIVAGVMQAFSDFFKAYHVPQFTKAMAILIAIGVISMVSTWIVGPAKGFLKTAVEGEIPPFFQKMNKNNMPVRIIIAQAGFLTLLSLAFLLMPNVSSSYWVLTDLASQLYMIMYVLLFLAGIRLRYTKPRLKRVYRIPGKRNRGMWIVAVIGIVTAIFALAIGFIPPADLKTGGLFGYEAFLIGGIILMLLLPNWIHSVRKASWKGHITRRHL